MIVAPVRRRHAGLERRTGTGPRRIPVREPTTTMNLSLRTIGDFIAAGNFARSSDYAAQCVCRAPQMTAWRGDRRMDAVASLLRPQLPRSFCLFSGNPDCGSAYLADVSLARWDWPPRINIVSAAERPAAGIDVKSTLRGPKPRCCGINAGSSGLFYYSSAPWNLRARQTRSPRGGL